MDIAQIFLKADASELDRASSKLDNLGTKVEQTNSKTKGLADGFRAVGGPLGDAADRADNFRGKLSELGGVASGLGGLGTVALGVTAIGVAAAAAAVGVINLVMANADLLDKFNDLSDQTNISTQRLQLLDQMAKMSGISLNDITGSAERLAGKLAKQDEETGKVAQGLKTLGIETKNAAGEQKSALEIQDEVIRKAGEAEDKAAAESAAVQVLGGDYYTLRGALAATVEEKTKLYEKLRDTGVLMDEQSKGAVKTFGDRIDGIKQSFSGMVNTITSLVLPIINTWLARLDSVLEKTAKAFRQTFNPSERDRLESQIASEQDKQNYDVMGLQRLRDKGGDPNNKNYADAIKTLTDRIEARRKLLWDLNRKLDGSIEREEIETKNVVNGTANEGPRTAPNTSKPPKTPKTKDDEKGTTAYDVPFAALEKAYNDALSKRDLFDKQLQDKKDQAAEDDARRQMDAAERIRDQLNPMRALQREIDSINQNIVLSEQEKTDAIVAASDRWVASQEKTKEATADQFGFMQRVGNSAFKSLEDSLVSMASSGKFSFKGLINAIIQDILRLFVQMQVIAPMMAMLRRMMGLPVTASADGNVFGGAGLLKSANGNVFDGPTLHAYSGGLGVLGEAGPEAVMPLRRGPDGQLGVRAQGGGSVQQNIQINVSVQGGKNDQETGRIVSAEVERVVRGVVKQELVTQQRAKMVAV